MGLVQRIIHDMTLAKGETPVCVKEGGATNWEPHFCWLPTRVFNFRDGFGQRVWLRTIERRWCKTADWLAFGPAHWPEYRLAPTTQPEKE